MAKTSRPKPPDSLDREGLLEWHRVCDELEDAGRLEMTDRATLTLYALTWQTWWEAEQNVQQHGPVVQLPNNIYTTSPYYDVAQQKATLLRGLMRDMGLSFASRPKTKPIESEELEL